jgi:hypothetical protein
MERGNIYEDANFKQYEFRHIFCQMLFCNIYNTRIVE